ncbi:MAG: phosphoribosyl-AMP cyclohydrolase [Spirochaetes bacterium]|nr:phosphoribosyl-AMP cyclohydrolase [Spirochaetota bacterium]
MIELNFKKLNGLIPAIAQDERTGEILMMAFMNKESWELTLKTGIVHYWSRSRNELWKKGETSGNIQKVKEIRVDCDNDTVLLKVEQIGGAACHTGYKSCFYKLYKNGNFIEDGVRIFNPEEVYGDKK